MSTYKSQTDADEAIGQRLTDPENAGSGAPSPEILAWIQREAESTGERIVFLLGVPAAPTLLSLLRELPENARFFLLERDTALAQRILSDPLIGPQISSGRLIPALGQDEKGIESRFFQFLDVKRAPEFKFFDPGTTAQDDMDFYVRILREFCKAARLDLFNAGTLVCRGPLWQFNTIVNIPSLVTHPGVGALQGIFRGKPAMVVGAGPSLDESVQALASVRDGFVVISTATALRALRTAGIAPDLVVAVDASHLTAPQFETRCDDLYLACSSLAFSPALLKFRGLFSGSLDANPIDSWLDSITTQRGMLFAGGTVTASAIDLAVKMGCSPVVTIGLDLSFTDDGFTHASHTMYHGHRLNPEQLMRVPGNGREWVLTTQQFNCYIELIEEYIEHHPGIPFINANHGGARIRGMKVISPSGIGCLSASPFDAAAIIQRIHSAYEPPASAVASVRAELETVLHQLDGIMSDVRRGAMICNQMIMILRAPQRGDDTAVHSALQELDDIDAQLAAARESGVFLRMSLWPASYQAGVRRAEHEEHYTDLMLAIRRSRELYEQIAGSARWTREALNRVLGQIPTTTDVESHSILPALETQNV